MDIFLEIILNAIIIGIFIYGIQSIMLKDRNKMEKGDFEFKQASEIDTKLDEILLHEFSASSQLFLTLLKCYFIKN